MQSSKIAFIFLVSFFFVQFVAASPRTARDAPEADKNVFEDIKTNVDKFFKETLQVDKIFEGLPDKMKEFGEKIETGAKEFAKNFKKPETTT